MYFPPLFQAGITLQEMTSTMEVFTAKNVALLAAAAVVSIAPALFKNRSVPV